MREFTWTLYKYIPTYIFEWIRWFSLNPSRAI